MTFSIYGKQSPDAPIGRWLPDLQVTRCMAFDYQNAVIRTVAMTLGSDAARSVGDCLIQDPCASEKPWTVKIGATWRHFATEFDALNWIRERRKLDIDHAGRAVMRKINSAVDAGRRDGKEVDEIMIDVNRALGRTDRGEMA